MQSSSTGFPETAMPLEGESLVWAILIAENLSRAGVEEEKAHRIAVSTARHCFNTRYCPTSRVDE